MPQSTLRTLTSLNTVM